MDEGSAVALAALVAVLAQSFFMILESRRSRAEHSKVMTASARLVRDELSGDLEAVHYCLTNGTWWPDELDSEPGISEEDRRLLAANADAETLRRSFGSLRRFRQLRSQRSRLVKAGELQLDHAQIVECTAVFLDLATARRALSPFTGYGTAPFSRPVHIPEHILSEGLAAAALETADGLYRPAPRPEPAVS